MISSRFIPAVPVLLAVVGLAGLVLAPARAEEKAIEVRLTTDGRLKRDPVFWPDGKSIVYAAEQPSGRMKLVRLNLEKKTTELLHPDEELSDREFSVSADGKTYAYNVVKGGPGLLTDAFVISKNRVIKVPAEAQWSSWPSLSSDGTRIVYSENGNKMFLFDIDFDDEDFRSELDKGLDEKKRKALEEKRKNARAKALKAGKLLAFKGDIKWPRFSPDGKQIAYGSPRDGDFEIFVIDATGKSEKQLTSSRGIDARPAWSPDGKRIAFLSNRDGNYEIYVMNADGSNQRRLTRHPERDDYPTWHPDGKSIVFVGERDGSLDLYSINVGDQ